MFPPFTLLEEFLTLARQDGCSLFFSVRAVAVAKGILVSGASVLYLSL
jgi:hypothetical protein